MSVRPDIGLERLIRGLEQELLEAPDEEFVAGARELGMNPQMKGSAAFVGVKSLSPQLLGALQRADRAPFEADAGPVEPGPRKPAKRNVDA
jgi:hypothetical protein